MLTDEPLVKGRYRALARVGAGAFGAVFRGVDTDTGATIAIKKIPIQPGNRRALEQLQQFSQEIAIFRRLNHRNVVRYLDDARTETAFYIIMEYAERHSLLHVLREQGPVPEELAVPIIRDVVAGLAYLHQEGIVHRDVKAANVLLTSDNTAKLSDFGLATAQMATAQNESAKRLKRLPGQADAAEVVPASPAAGSAQLEGELVGSVYWMAPEVIRLYPPTKASDIWSLGCLIVEVLTGKPPLYDRSAFNAMYHLAESDASPIPAPLLDTASPSAIAFLNRCFVRDSAKRPSASELLKDPWLSPAGQSDDEEDAGEAELILDPRPSFLTIPSVTELSQPRRFSVAEQDSGRLSVSESSPLRRSSDALADGDRALRSSPEAMHTDLSDLRPTSFDRVLEKMLAARYAQRETWIVKERGIEKAVQELATGQPAQSTAIVAAMARFVKGKSSVGTSETKTQFFHALGETDFWNLDLWETVDHTDLCILFCACCDHQLEGRCSHPAVAQGKVAAQLLSQPNHALRVAVVGALNRALTRRDAGGRESVSNARSAGQHHSSDLAATFAGVTGTSLSATFSMPPASDATAGDQFFVSGSSSEGVGLSSPTEDIQRRLSMTVGGLRHSLHRKTNEEWMLEGGVLQAVVRAAELLDVADEDLDGSWQWVDNALEIILLLTQHNDDLFLQQMSSELAVAVVQATRRHCEFGAIMYARWAKVDTSACLEVAGIAPLLAAATDPALHYRVRVEVARTFAELQRNPAGAELLESGDSVPLLGHILGTPPPSGSDDDMIAAFLDLFEESHFAAACAAHPKFLRVIIEKLRAARAKTDSDVLDALLLLKLLFMNAPKPEMYFTCQELLGLLARLLQEGHRSADVVSEASRILDGLSAAVKIV